MFERPRLLISLEGSVRLAQKSCSKTTDDISNSSELFPLLVHCCWLLEDTAPHKPSSLSERQLCVCVCVCVSFWQEVRGVFSGLLRGRVICRHQIVLRYKGQRQGALFLPLELGTVTLL